MLILYLYVQPKTQRIFVHGRGDVLSQVKKVYFSQFSRGSSKTV